MSLQPTVNLLVRALAPVTLICPTKHMCPSPFSSADATGLLNGTGPELQAGTLFAATDTALDENLAKWVPSLAADLASVADLQGPQYTTLLRKTVLVSFLNSTDSVAGPPSLTDDPSTSIVNKVDFPEFFFTTRTFTNLL